MLLISCPFCGERHEAEFSPGGEAHIQRPDPTAASDPSHGKDIQTTYNQAGQITAVNDLGTGVSTTYTYDLLGHRLSEVITTPISAANRNR